MSAGLLIAVLLALSLVAALVGLGLKGNRLPEPMRGRMERIGRVGRLVAFAGFALVVAINAVLAVQAKDWSFAAIDALGAALFVYLLTITRRASTP